MTVLLEQVTAVLEYLDLDRPKPMCAPLLSQHADRLLFIASNGIKIDQIGS